MYFPRLVRQLIPIVCALFFVTFSSGLSPALVVQAQEQASLDQFDLLDDHSGWMLLDRYLFWTSDAGRSWTEITPSISSEGDIQDVQFIDVNRGWVLWMTTDPNVGASLHLEKTNDRGKTWISGALSVFEEGDTASYAEKAEMSWLSPQSGWIA